MVRIKLFYARDFRALLLKYGRLDAATSLIGTEGQPPPRHETAPDPDAARGPREEPTSVPTPVASGKAAD